jgi:hypothetical protein
MLGRTGLSAALALGLVACGNPAPQEQGKGETATGTTAGNTGAGAPTAAAASETPDACTLVTPDELAAIFAGRSFTQDALPAERRNSPGGPRRNAVTSCTFVSTGASIPDMMTVSIVLTTAHSDKAQPTMDKMWAGAAKLGQKVELKTVDGLGDGAYWFNIGGGSRSGIVLSVMRNPRHWLAVSESSSGQEESVTVSRLSAVAKAALGRF